MIELKGVRKSYGANEVLKGIDLGIEEQDYLVILGASGSGKSTLLNILSGLEKPDQGEVLYDGENIASLRESQLTKFRKNQVAFIFQQYYLLQELTVVQNVKMGAHLAKNQDYLPIIEAMGLKEKLHQYPSELSGGQQQRVAIARSLVNHPVILLADEATGNLDTKTSYEVMELFQRLNDQGSTIGFVTHENDIALFSKRTVVLKDGHIISDKEVTNRLNAKEELAKIVVED